METDFNTLFSRYRALLIEATALKEEFLRAEVVPPKIIVDSEAFIGTVDLETAGTYMRLCKEALARHKDDERLDS